MFLRQAWRHVATSVAWLDAQRESARREPDEPGAGAGRALDRILASGASAEDGLEVVRVAQWEMLFALCYQLEDPGELEPEISDMQWSLVQVDDAGNVGPAIGILRESVLVTDPTGREMRPLPSTHCEDREALA